MKSLKTFDLTLLIAMCGHDVSLNNITTNYNKGFENLENHFRDFDAVMLVQSFTRGD